MDDVYKAKRELALREHIQKMSKINEGRAQTDRKIEEMKEKLALVRSKNANLKEKEIRMRQMREEVRMPCNLCLEICFQTLPMYVN